MTAKCLLYFLCASIACIREVLPRVMASRTSREAASSNDGPKSKRAKKPTIMDVHGGKRISARALAGVLKYIDEHGVPEAISASSYARERDKICSQDTPSGPIVTSAPVTLLTGKEWDLPLQHPFAFLYVILKKSDGFRAIFRDRCEKHSYRLTMGAYTDECTPMNVLKSDNRLKALALYWSLLEFGEEHLANCDFWFTGVAARSESVKNIDGALNNVFGRFLKMVWPGEGFDGRHGVMLPVGENCEMRLVEFNFDLLVEDHLAHKEVLDIKGSGGVITCVKCKNCTKPGSRFDPDATGYCKTYRVLDIKEFDPQTTVVARGVLRHLYTRKATATATAVHDEKITFGWNLPPNNWIMDPALQFIDVVGCVMYDWFHTYLQGGDF